MEPLLIYRDRRAVMTWLAVCLLLVAAMVLIGGYTRLSGSGLSITSWKPVHGVIPPLDEAQWQEEFAAYQQSPQYQKINSDMGLDDFKVIFWPEFIHRLLGRMIGAAFFLPLIMFALRRSIGARFGWRLAGIFALGGVQGLIGWLMVKSGLVDDPHVSPIKLALHLCVAFAIYALILWALLDVILVTPCAAEGSKIPPQGRDDNKRVIKWYRLWLAGLCLQIILGAFMAGLHAGLVYNTWPTMNGQWLPDGLFSNSPWYLNFFENITLIQFMHRKLAVLLAAGFLLWWYSQREYVKNSHLGKVCFWVAAILAAQFTLGVLTLLNMVPLALALAHQMTALLLFTMGVVLMHALTATTSDKRTA